MDPAEFSVVTKSYQLYCQTMHPQAGVCAEKVLEAWAKSWQSARPWRMGLGAHGQEPASALAMAGGEVGQGEGTPG